MEEKGARIVHEVSDLRLDDDNGSPTWNRGTVGTQFQLRRDKTS